MSVRYVTSNTTLGTTIIILCKYNSFSVSARHSCAYFRSKGNSNILGSAAVGWSLMSEGLKQWARSILRTRSKIKGRAQVLWQRLASSSRPLFNLLDARLLSGTNDYRERSVVFTTVWTFRYNLATHVVESRRCYIENTTLGANVFGFLFGFSSGNDSRLPFGHY